MNTPTYKEQFDKITSAYLENELEPLDECACFIGNLLNNNNEWSLVRDFKDGVNWASIELETDKDDLSAGIRAINTESAGLYNVFEIMEMEKNFLCIWANGGENEDSLFEAMSSTLDMLRNIHESKGEVINPITFTKRQLVNS